VSVTGSPAQIVELFAEAVMVGNAFTVIAIVEVFEHPFPSVPVTVYVVEAVGLSVTGDPVSDPGIQSYVAAPLPVNVTASPVHVVLLEADAVTVGNAFTVTSTVAVFEHPGPFEPVTV
jgi:hypothetical protein